MWTQLTIFLCGFFAGSLTLWIATKLKKKSATVATYAWKVPTGTENSGSGGGGWCRVTGE